LARQHGLYSVAHPLRLDYVQLKKRVGGVVRIGSEVTKAPRKAAASASECVIEFESALGGKMRIQWMGAAGPDWTSLLRAWREAHAS